MSIPPSYDLEVVQDDKIEITHPYSDTKAFNFLKENLDPNKVLDQYGSTFGQGGHVSKKQNHWVVENYPGLNEIVEKFSEDHSLRIPKSVAEAIK